MTESTWKVVPLSQGQLLDVSPEDVLEGGLYRKCNTYKGGGGYDQFPTICEKKLGLANQHEQFIVQLFGCHLDCPYCYVTRQGVWGEPVLVSDFDLFSAFELSGQQVFHMMGGAPAIHMSKWPRFLARFARWFPENVFHSDLLLTERSYNKRTLHEIAQYRNVLLAVDIKGMTEEEHQMNTRKSFKNKLFWRNLFFITTINVPFYITFTNVSEMSQRRFWNRYLKMFPKQAAEQKELAFSIDLIEYKALPHVDKVLWGGESRA